jgi:hypothetical protein
MASQLAKLVAMYSTSIELNATEICFMLNHEMTVDPKLKQHPEVLFRSVSLPSQYESKYPCNLTPSPPRYCNPYLTVPYKYLSM